MINPNKIIAETERLYHIPKGSIVSKNRSKTISEARNVAIYATRRTTRYSSTEIGEYYFNRDHSTILNSVKKANQKMANKVICLVQGR